MVILVTAIKLRSLRDKIDEIIKDAESDDEPYYINDTRIICYLRGEINEIQES